MDAKQIKFSVGGGTTTLLTNLVFYYKMDETSGTDVDDATGIQDGTTNATVGATGKIGYSETFDGSTDCMQADYNSSASMTGTSFSVSCWVYLTTLPSTLGYESYIIRGVKGSDPWETLTLTIYTDNKVYFTVKNNDATPVTYQVESSGTVTTGQWYHIVGVCLGASQALKLYINGSDVSTDAETFTGTLHENTGGWAFGDAYSGAGSGLAGSLDECAGWRKGLSSSEVTELYNSGSGKTHPFS